MLKAEIIRLDLDFAFSAKTSRGTLTKKTSWYLQVFDDAQPEIKGMGECSPIWGLSPEKEEEYTGILEHVQKNINQFEQLFKHELPKYPSIFFGLETALMDLFKGGKKIFFDNAFTKGQAGIKINGLVWMNTIDEMYQQALEKAKQGFTCIKLKIGALNTGEELMLIHQLRKELGHDITIRVDANGAFDYPVAVEVMKKLKEFKVHSIEQPLKPGQAEKMRELCKLNLVPVALDEELIGIYQPEEKEKLLNDISPQYVILKPSLHGGFLGSRQWIDLATRKNMGWWMTSALESNIGLNAIAQYTFETGNSLPQGLGTGKIYKNNIESPLHIEGETLKYEPSATWEM